MWGVLILAAVFMLVVLPLILLFSSALRTEQPLCAVHVAMVGYRRLRTLNTQGVLSLKGLGCLKTDILCWLIQLIKHMQGWRNVNRGGCAWTLWIQTGGGGCWRKGMVSHYQNWSQETAHLR